MFRFLVRLAVVMPHCKRAPFNRYHFELHTVQRETGKSAKEYLRKKLLEAAKEQLLNPQKSISQVAQSLGFQYPQHFVRFFKRMTGMTPSKFRENKEKIS